MIERINGERLPRLDIRNSLDRAPWSQIATPDMLLHALGIYAEIPYYQNCFTREQRAVALQQFLDIHGSNIRTMQYKKQRLININPNDTEYLFDGDGSLLLMRTALPNNKVSRTSYEYLDSDSVRVFTCLEDEKGYPDPLQLQRLEHAPFLHLAPSEDLGESPQEAMVKLAALHRLLVDPLDGQELGFVEIGFAFSEPNISYQEYPKGHMLVTVNNLHTKSDLWINRSVMFSSESLPLWSVNRCTSLRNSEKWEQIKMFNYDPYGEDRVTVIANNDRFAQWQYDSDNPFTHPDFIEVSLDTYNRVALSQN